MLRKKYNKLYHDSCNYEEKMKYFQQLSTEMDIDIEHAKQRRLLLLQEQTKFAKVLNEKDKEILNQEKIVKELLSKNINNFTH